MISPAEVDRPTTLNYNNHFYKLAAAEVARYRDTKRKVALFALGRSLTAQTPEPTFTVHATKAFEQVFSEGALVYNYTSTRRHLVSVVDLGLETCTEEELRNYVG